MEMVINAIGYFIIGFLTGTTMLYLFFNKVHNYLTVLDKKHDKIINILSHWQKKI